MCEIPKGKEQTPCEFTIILSIIQEFMAYKKQQSVRGSL